MPRKASPPSSKSAIRSSTGANRTSIGGRQRRAVGRILLLVALPVAISVGAASANHRGAPVSQELAFTLTIPAPAGSAVCVAHDLDVRRARRLTNVGRYQADWSPDGRRIALAGGKRGTHPIRVQNADGTAVRPVSTPQGATEDDSSPTWSPDGRNIAFTRYVCFGPRVDYGRAGIWIVDLETGRERQIGKELATLSCAPSGDVLAAEIGARSRARSCCSRQPVALCGISGRRAGVCSIEGSRGRPTASGSPSAAA
jgi:WD40-like Beta Propeller Repeat